jgi:tellurite methyltransferase
MSNENKNWETYYKKVSARPPRPLLIKGVAAFENTKNNLPLKAVDFGAGAGVDTKYLLERGFSVCAIDKHEQSNLLLNTLIGFGDLEVINQDFSIVEIPSNSFFYSSLSLPFCEANSFDDIWLRIVESIEVDGLFCGNFFGKNDDWKDKLHTHSDEDISNLFSRFKILDRTEEEKDAPSATGPTKHWHIITIIAQKVL